MNALSFFRIKAGITDPDVILRSRHALEHSNVRVGGKRVGDLYVQRLERSEPRWLAYFGSSVDLTGVSLKTASLAAVLLMKRGPVLYAVVFGYGRYLLADGVVDDRFGLRATLNAVEPSQLRSVDHKRLEAISRHTREQLSRAGPLDQFGLDVDRDLVRAVTGAPKDGTHGRRMSGADQLTVLAQIPLAELGDRLDRYGELADQKAYVDDFPWVDNIREVRDASLRTELARKLARELAADPSPFSIAPPELIDWSTTEGFRYHNRRGATVYADLDLDDYFAACGGASTLTADRLTSDRIYHVRAEEPDAQRSWPVLRCVVGECHLRKQRYVLNEGNWYEIEERFLQEVEDFIAGIPSGSLTLPNFADDSEQAYNARVAAADPARYALLDQDFIRYPPHGQVEVCDIFTAERQLMHVKRYAASSTLSHLFSQGMVSAELLLRDAGFRRQLLDKLPERFRWGAPDDAIRASDFDVCFVIIGRRNRQLSLPFFSKVSLRAAVRNLRQLGFGVSLTGVTA